MKEMRRTIWLSMHNDSRGQSLIIALTVMFIMMFLGTVFVTLLTRNLRSSIRSGDVLNARQLAEAGIRYADRMLTYGADGADWRPVPDNLDPAANSNDPDLRWLQPFDAANAPTGGFTRILSGNGRFLIRVSYNPDRNDPMSRYIKIESVGRVGVVDPDDPTTLASGGPIRLRHELTAYKPIGITDYLRFVTNKAKLSDAFTFGRKEGAPLQFGATPDKTGPIRVNGDLLWQGDNIVYLRGVGTGSEILPLSAVEVAGDILHDANTSVNVQTVVVGGPSPSGNAAPSRLNGSLNNGFTAFQGFYRDGSDIPDTNGFARNIRRLDPPLVDLEDPSTGQVRYRQLTADSGEWAKLGSRTVNSARYGYGRGLYIDNRRDVQEEGSSIFGGRNTLASEWTHPDRQRNWKGAYYVPPGAVLRVTPDGNNGSIYITRTDITRSGQKYTWHSYDPVNKVLTAEPGYGPTYRFDYPENGVVFAEGNIRITGVVKAGRQLTIVSNENIYIEGNIIKEDENTSAIALLARKNVVLNTTQFLSLPPASSAVWESTRGTGEPPFAYRVSTAPDTNFRTSFDFGVISGSAGIGPRLFIRHAAAGQAASINLFINGAPYPFSPGVFNYLMSDAATQFAPVYEGMVFDMAVGGGPAALNDQPGVRNYLEIGLHQTGIQQSRGDYLLERMAVLPMDITIEALMYAQEGSFFVIPGPWFNSNPDDTAANFADRGFRPAYIKNQAFPFYGDPLDIKITIDGAIAENVTASQGDIADWMRKWGVVPPTYGSSGDPTAHAGDGLMFRYDDRLSYPVLGNGFIRTDAFGRALPITPHLPVSTDLIYVGRMTGT